MDKNKFWLGGRIFNTAPPRLGAPMQRKARPQVGRPNTMQGTSASWPPNAHLQRKCKARLQDGCPNATQGTSARWAPKRNTRHVRKLCAPTQRKARSQVGFPNACPQHKRKARPHFRKLGVETQQKARPQDGRPNAKLIRNENVHTREH